MGMTKSELEQLYKTNSLRDIAKIMNISYNKIRDIFFGYKIKTRHRGNHYDCPHIEKKYFKKFKLKYK